MQPEVEWCESFLKVFDCKDVIVIFGENGEEQIGELAEFDLYIKRDPGPLFGRRGM